MQALILRIDACGPIIHADYSAERQGADSRCSCATEARAAGGNASLSLKRASILDKVRQRVVEQNIEQSTGEQILDLPMPLLQEHLVEVPKILFQDRIRQRTFEQFADTPFLQVVEELVFKVFSKDRDHAEIYEQATLIQESVPFNSGPKPTAGGVDCELPKANVTFVDKDEDDLLEGEPEEEMCEPPWSESLDLLAGETEVTASSS